MSWVANFFHDETGGVTVEFIALGGTLFSLAIGVTTVTFNGVGEQTTALQEMTSRSNLICSGFCHNDWAEE